jgi:hypothetical protein
MSGLADIVRKGATRGLDFVSLDELRKRTGVQPSEVLRFALSEMVCNSLDKPDAARIEVELRDDGAFYSLSVADNGSKKLTREELQLILDFENKASSKRGFLRVSRGYLGNALKCLFGYSYALAESKGLSPPPVIVQSGGFCHKIVLKPDRVWEVIDSEIESTDASDDGLTMLTVKFPRDDVSLNPSALWDMVSATHMVNPDRTIIFRVNGRETILAGSGTRKPLRRETSLLWYNSKQFTDLFNDFLRTVPETKLGDFIALFRGFRRDNRMCQRKLQELNAGNHDSGRAENLQFAFSPGTPIRDLPAPVVGKLFALLKDEAKPIRRRSIPSVLGIVGEESFKRLCERNGWKNLRYIVLCGNRMECPEPNHDGSCPNPDHVEFPCLIELAVLDRLDQEGLKLYQCVNFMASTEDVFSRLYNIPYHLGRAGIGKDTSMTVVAHLVCPVLRWLSYGKSVLEGISTIGSMLEKAFNKVLPIPKTPRVYRPPRPPKPLSWVPHGKIGDINYERRLSDFAGEILVADAQRSRRVKYSTRGWCYFMESKISKEEFKAFEDAFNDCRKIGLLPIDFVAEDQDETRRFQGIVEASDPAALLRRIGGDVESFLENLPASTTDYWRGEKFYVIMCVEKGDILNLFKPICDEYKVPIVSSKGWPPILLRAHIANLSKKAESNGLTPVLLLFYDHDPAGLKITETFRKNLRDCERGTGWSPKGLIIERFGLNKEDIDRHGLTWIENLKTGSGREAKDPQYIAQFGRRKCESNALFKNDDTLRAAEEICRRAIEKYYGQDALERFKQKEQESKAKLGLVYDDPVWKTFSERIGDLAQKLSQAEPERPREQEAVSETEVEVAIREGYYGRCPGCGHPFNYDESDIGRLMRCRVCNLPMRLRKK